MFSWSFTKGEGKKETSTWTVREKQPELQVQLDSLRVELWECLRTYGNLSSTSTERTDLVTQRGSGHCTFRMAILYNSLQEPTIVPLGFSLWAKKGPRISIQQWHLTAEGELIMVSVLAKEPWIFPLSWSQVSLQSTIMSNIGYSSRLANRALFQV